MNVEEFEQLAAAAPDTVTWEFVAGRLAAKPPRDGDHSEIVVWLGRHCATHLPRHWLYESRGLRVGTALRDRVRPDGVLAPRRFFAGHGEWSAPDGVLMTVEVTSHDADTNSRDRVEKRDGYAAAGIPVYLPIDRDTCSVTVYSEPRDGAYRHAVSAAYGEDVELPEPVGVALPTEGLKDFAD